MTTRTCPHSPSLRGRPFIEARSAPTPTRWCAARRPFGDGPSSRLPAGRQVRRPDRHSPSLRGRPFIEARAPTPSGGQWPGLAVPSGTALHRGYVKTAPTSTTLTLAVPSGTALHRGVAYSASCAAAKSSPSLRGRPFIEAAATSAHGSSRNSSPSLRGRPFIEARSARSSGRWPPPRRPFGDGPSSRLGLLLRPQAMVQLAVPSGTALHRGEATGRASASGPSRRPFGDGPSSRRATRSMTASRHYSPSLRGTALHRGSAASAGTRGSSRSPSLRGRPFIEAP